MLINLLQNPLKRDRVGLFVQNVLFPDTVQDRILVKAGKSFASLTLDTKDGLDRGQGKKPVKE